MIIKNEKLTFDELLDRIEYDYFLDMKTFKFTEQRIYLKEDLNIQKCVITDIPQMIVITARKEDKIDLICKNNTFINKKYKNELQQDPVSKKDFEKQQIYSNKKNIY